MMQYEFKNGAVLKIPEKFVIIAINLWVCYLIVNIGDIKLLPISKLMVIGIEFEILRKKRFAYSGIVKSYKKIKSG